MVARKLIPKFSLTDFSVETEISFKPEQGAPEGRFPVGDGFYRTPEIIDPRDPVNYPDSPWNGGNPLSSTAVALDINIRLHPCGVDLSVQPTLFLKLPIGGLSYRLPGECRNEPPPPKTEINQDIQTKPMDWEQYKIKDTDIVVAAVAGDFLTTSKEQRLGEGGDVLKGNASSLATGGISYPAEKSFGLYEAFYGWNLKFVQNEFWQSWYWDRSTPLTTNHSGNGSLTANFAPGGYGARAGGAVFGLFHGYFSDLKKLYPSEQRRIFTQIFKTATNSRGQKAQLVDEYTDIFTYKVQVLNLSNLPYSKNPPPPPPDKDDCCMECCSQTNQTQDDNSDLLRRILKKVENVETRLGCKDYPFNVPASFIQKHEGFLASLLPKPTQKIENTQEFLRWIALTFEEIYGQWEIPIEIKDSDPTKPGDQPQGMKLANMAEAFAELTAIGANASVNSEVLINIATRLLYELAAARQTTADTNAKTQALIDFFGFKTKETRDFMPLTFTTGKDRLDETLKESQQPVALTKFDDPKKSYKQDMAALLSAAGVIKAVFTKKVKGADQAGTTAAIASLIRDTAKAQKKSKSSLSKELTQDFETWCEAYERGWMEEIAADPNKPNEPWGEPYAERPKVVKIIKSKPPEIKK